MFKFIMIGLFLLGCLKPIHAREIDVYTSTPNTSGTFIILSYLTKEINEKSNTQKFTVGSIPGAIGLTAYNRFVREPDSLLFVLDDMFKVHNLPSDKFDIYYLIYTRYSVMVSSKSDIRTVQDLVRVSNQRRVFHGRLVGGPADFVLNEFIEENKLRNVENITSYKRADELAIALNSGELDFIIRSAEYFKSNNLVRVIQELNDGSRWVFVSHKNQNSFSQIDNFCKSNDFRDFMAKAGDYDLTCSTTRPN